METENIKQTRKEKRLSIPMHGTNLKLYGCITMVFYTLSVSVFQIGLLRIGEYDSIEAFSGAVAADPSLMSLSTWATVLQMIGWLSVPVFAFLLVEGFQHTSSFKRYLLTMLGFAVVSEIPYDLAMSGSLWNLNSQNSLCTLSICLIMLYGLRLYSGRKGAAVRVTQGLVILAAVLWCGMLGSAFGLCTVLLTATYYSARQFSRHETRHRQVCEKQKLARFRRCDERRQLARLCRPILPNVRLCAPEPERLSCAGCDLAARYV